LLWPGLTSTKEPHIDYSWQHGVQVQAHVQAQVLSHRTLPAVSSNQVETTPRAPSGSIGRLAVNFALLTIVNSQIYNCRPARATLRDDTSHSSASHCIGVQSITRIPFRFQRGRLAVEFNSQLKFHA
jgi:hypothetical protein